MGGYPVRTARDLGAALRQGRKDLRLTQQELADRIGVSRQWVIQVEKGKSRATLGLVLKALTALGYTLRVDDGSRGEDGPLSVAGPLSATSTDLEEVLNRAREPRS